MIDVSKVKALTFDVFGTVVDWRGSIVRYGSEIEQELQITVDWTRFADAWRAAYRPSMDLVRQGRIPWTNIDRLHRKSLDALAPKFGLDGLNEVQKDQLNRIWHRLDPWPDAASGLRELGLKFTVATLSNGNISLLADMAKRAGLNWDLILSAELFRRYKPDPEVYKGAMDLLGLQPFEVMMVAAHSEDLKAARSIGMQTAYVHRPLEYGPGMDNGMPTEEAFDLYAADFADLTVKIIGLIAKE